MNMKMKLYILLAFFTLLTASCSDWLDVEPKSSVKSDALFETEAGFKDALTGVYLLMSQRSMYGLELTVGFADILGQQYTFSPGFNTYDKDSQYKYEEPGVEARIASIWLAMYNTIANVNNILKNIEIHKDVLHPTSYGIIKGECLGLRAFLHFDLLRLFGYENLANKQEYWSLPALPYVMEYHKSIVPQLSTADYVKHIEQDLNDAYVLLLENDPYSVQPKAENYYLPNDDQYYTHRNRHFNYFALRATQARFYLWIGKRSEALSCAQEIIDNNGRFAWIQEQVINNKDEKARDLTFSTEHIWGLNVYNLNDNVERFINPEINGSNINYDLLYHTKEQADKIYEIGAGIGNSDYRYTQLYKPEGNQYILLKFVQPEGYQYPDIMPVIRKTEAYYIAAECLNATGDGNDKKIAIDYLNIVRMNRGIVPKLTEVLTQEQVAEEIYKEYKKEFVSEGQLFYFYKRLGYATIPGFATVANTKVYKLPIPDVEIDFGGRVN